MDMTAPTKLLFSGLDYRINAKTIVSYILYTYDITIGEYIVQKCSSLAMRFGNVVHSNFEAV